MQNISHENDLIFKRMNEQVTCIFIRIVLHKDSFCHRGKSRLFIHELAHGVFDIYSIPALSVLFFSIIQRSVLMAYNNLSLQRYVRKGSDANNLAILSFSLICYQKKIT